MSNHPLKKKARKLFDQEKLSEAKKLYQRLCQKDRQDTESWFDLGTLHGMQGENEAALECFKHVLALQPNFAEAHFNMARCLGLLNQKQAACQAYLQALRLKPDWVQAMNNLANLLQAQGHFNAALNYYQRALTLAPGYTEALLNKSNVLLLMGKSHATIDGLRTALKQAPNHLIMHRNLCLALTAAGRFDEAMAGYDKMKKCFPDDPEPLASKAKLLGLMGDRTAARAAIAPLMEKYPNNPHVAVVYATLNQHQEYSQNCLPLLENILKQQMQLDNEIKAQIHFLLGKIHDEQNNYGQAFEHYYQANELIKRPFNTEQQSKHIDDIITQHSAGHLKPKSTLSVKKAVFIVGMPRSGTSLVEQILDSHPAITGAGELSEIFDIADSISAQLDGKPAYPAFMSQLTTELCDQMAQRYLQRLEQTSNQSIYVTDKMPQNFLYLGLINRLFPEAHIIHCQRDPRDTCLSCYFQNFTVGQSYSNDLTSLAQYYRQYQRLMRHWQTNLDIPILTVQYEKLVSEPEPVIRSMLDFLELEWDENCLNFHNNRRVVNTASVDQVRQPMYTKSVARWKHYQDYIGPLLDALTE